MIKFRYEGDAVGKARPRYTAINGHIRTYTPAKTANFEEAIRYAFISAYHGNKPAFNKDVPVVIYINIGVSIPKSWSKKKQEQAKRLEILPTKKPDLDNVLKSIFDALNGYAYEDDAQIIKIQAERYYTEEEPFIEVAIYEFS